MTVLGYKGQVVHHNDCTWCVHRFKMQAGTKSKKKEIERCRLTGKDLPHVWNLEKLQRFCERYIQQGCTCERCNP